MEIRHKTRSFPVKVVPNAGLNNNCLGYALGPMLKQSPEDLRDSICRFVESCDRETLREVYACSIVQEFESIPESRRFEVALAHLKGHGFIPADLFVAYCQAGPDRRRLLHRNNVVFLAERTGYYEPVTHYLDNVSRRTQYIGCDNTHYEALEMSPRHQMQFDLMYFGVT